MSKTYRIVAAIIVIAIAGFAGWRVYQARRARLAGILNENIVHNGDTWTADFAARIPAPEQSVFDAIRNVENARSEQVQAVKVISQGENTKTVEMTLAGPGGQPLVTTLAFEYMPAERRISYRTVDSPALDTNAEYRFTDEGASTLIAFHETTRMLQQIPVPDAVVKQVIRSIFVAQLEGLQRTLNITNADESGDEDD